MLLSIEWLKELVPYEGSIDTLADRLTMTGLEVEEVVNPFAGLEKVVVGKVLTCEKHPDADKLSVCTVDAGQEAVLDIVCGAPNVAAGQLVPVALIGADLPNGMKIKKGKIRGKVSCGMICAEDELGLGSGHKGIMVLESGTPGQPLIDALGLATQVLDIGVTPNRADCFCMIGLAREVAMSFDLPLRLPQITFSESGAPATESMRVQIDDADLCPVYQGRIIENVSDGRAPDWMRFRLLAMGMRPISTIVDVTNYVMLEYGQPLHAFDMNLLRGGMIRVARAQQGMKFTTLDNQERTLLDTDILIWDGERPVALAGVMGGANTEINTESSTVFLESAIFHPLSIRRTARRLNLPSESSFRFERGVDQPGSLTAMNRAASLMAEFCGGTLRPGIVSDEPRPWKQRTFSFRPKRANSLLGIELDDAFCRRIITGMGCNVDESAGETWRIEAPSHRLDLEREVDIIEELGRMYGMDKIEAKLPSVPQSVEPRYKGEGEFAFGLRLKHWARGIGLREAINYSFVGHRDLDFLGLEKDNRISVKNPLSDEQDVLRTILAPGLLQSARQNIAQGNDSLRLFEFAHVFHADASSETTAREPVRIGLLVYGGRWTESWPWRAETADYLDLKGLVEHLLQSLRLPVAKFELAGEDYWREPYIRISLEGREIGYMGRVKEELAKEFHARQDLWIAELDADALRELFNQNSIQFMELPKFPPSWRDITVVSPPSLEVEAIFETIRSQKSRLLEDVSLIDVFVPEGEKNAERRLTFRLTFRHGQRTLKDKDVDKEMANMSKSLTNSLPVRL